MIAFDPENVRSKVSARLDSVSVKVTNQGRKIDLNFKNHFKAVTKPS